MLNNNIKIALLEISPQNKAILEFYFDSAGKEFFKVVPEDKANAFIIDYDQPGAKEHLEKIHADSKTPIVLISIKEQEIPSTVWVAKPITADALSKAATSINQLLADSDQSESTLVEEKVIEKTEDSAVDENEIVSKSIEAQEVEIEKKENESDAFEILSESHIDNANQDSLGSSVKKVEAQENKSKSSGITLAGASALVAATVGADDLETKSEDQNISEESSLLDFAETATEVQNDATDSEDEDDIDSLLNSLMQDDVEEESEVATIDVEDDSKDVENEDVTEKIEAEDAFLDNLLTDAELENEAKDNVQNKDTLELLKSVDDELEDNLDLNKAISEESEVAELNILNEDKVEFLSEDSLAENDLEEEQNESSNDLSLEVDKSVVNEDFTLHDDQDPSTEDVFADTLEVNYAEVKSDKKKEITDPTEPSTDPVEDLILELESSIEEPENDTNSAVEDTLDNDLFDFDALNEDSSSPLEKEDEPELTLDKNDVDAIDEESIPTSDIDDEIDHDIDNLINEMSDETVDSKVNKTASTEDDFNSSDLQSLLNEVRQEAGKSSGSNSFGDKSDSESHFEQTKAERRWMQLCGNVQPIKVQKDVAQISFDHEKFLLGLVLEQIKLAKNKEQLFRLKYQDLIIVFDYDKDRIYCNLPLTSDEYSEICFNEIESKHIKIYDLDYSEERLYKTKIEENPNRAHTIEAFIWTTSLLTSRGRLPKNTNITKTVGLKTWPNLTRLELIPHAMNMAAVFAKHPGNLIEISDWLQIPQRYVFAFYNAALSLEMIDFDCKQVKKSGFSFGKKDSKKNTEERSFFGRLLKRLKS